MPLPEPTLILIGSAFLIPAGRIARLLLQEECTCVGLWQALGTQIEHAVLSSEALDVHGVIRLAQTFLIADEFIKNVTLIHVLPKIPIVVLEVDWLA